ncbi:glucan biosynthesis protein [Marinobacter sp.]|uniref:glucan biosynthesis protein n=1 Tax=Marinobacter sp. TaxID=50741 RepID=UPI002B4726D2|nr:glucan biosynthesis protein [Marinobacter sp.]HKK56589.1 glucan biosynthesis protein [Marinobacter sp.]
MDRRSLLKLGLALGAGLPFTLTVGSGVRASAHSPSASAGQPFSYDWLREHARELSARDYQPASNDLPARLTALNWDQYQQIRYRPDQALWRNRDSAFQIQFFHPGLYFLEPVKFFELVDGRAHKIGYESDHFDYGDNAGLAELSPDLHYAGFRLHFHQDFDRDLAAFLGASYFRAVGESRQYGLSARGFAVDTGLPVAEEFPRFRTFWLQRPEPGDLHLTVFALLDSPGLTGAYRFVIHPGRNLDMAVSASIFPRTPLHRFGVAPLTSMYQTGENDRRMATDWRPEIHDSDGLAIWRGNGERLWRPLTNPANLRVSHFVDTGPRGFGLFQRDRNFDHYQDDGVFYDRRPSLWVEPGEDWGEGAVLLVEIPTRDETFDNIVAFWNPARAWLPGNEYPLSYRLTWGEKMPDQAQELARVRATRTGIGGVVGQPRTYFSRRFAVDFSGGTLAMLDAEAGVEAVVSASRGRTELISARPLHALDGFRAMFDLVPGDDTDPIELRLYLKLGNQALTETWLYQYIPPEPEHRNF